MGIVHDGYERLVPNRFWRSSAASKHRFAVIDPWWQPFEIVRLKTGDLLRIESSAYCQLFIGQAYVPILVPVASHPAVANVIFDLAQLSTGGRSTKYVALFKMYEALCPQPEIRFAALRHAFTHAKTVLNRPKTIATLLAAFGSVHVNLTLQVHQKVFWGIYSDLLIEVDKLVAAEVRALGDIVKMPKIYEEPLTVPLAEYYYPDQLSKLLPSAALKTDAPKHGARFS